MAKTVFGIPGVNEKSIGGAPVAPQGTGPMPAAAPAPAPEPEPVPMVAPMAKMPAAGPVAGAKSAAANRTMFGMPAMKLPVATPAAEPAPVPIATPAPAPAPSAAPATESPDDAFKATMLGMPAMDLESLSANPAEQPVAAARDTEPTTAPASSTAPQTIPAPASSVPATASPSPAASAPQLGVYNRELDPTRPKEPSPKLVMGILGGLVFFVIAVAFVIWFFVVRPASAALEGMDMPLNSAIPADLQLPPPSADAP